MIPILESVPWQMTPAERAALEGILTQVKPDLALEIGTAEGGSLRCIAGHSGQVHSFDLVVPPMDMDELPNVTLHTGDSHRLLPEVLAELAREGRNVDFALVDGDHTADGVEQDVRDLLNSDAVQSTVIVLHDIMNDEVRAGLARIDYAAESKVAHVDLNFLTGRLNYGGVFHHQLWGGLGLIVVDARRTGPQALFSSTDGAYSAFELIAPVRDAIVAYEQRGGSVGPGSVRSALPVEGAGNGHAPDLQAQLTELQGRYDVIRNSKSWRLTEPLRSLAHALRARRT